MQLKCNSFIIIIIFLFFFFKQKTAYEIYQCDWSSDVCSSDLISENKPVTIATVAEILNKLGEKRPYKSHFRPDPETLQIFVEGSTISVNLTTGEVSQESVRNRPVLREMNFLHLNHPKKLWTYFSDLYAVSLALLAITGVFVIRGRKGIKGRGKWWVAAGVVLPVLFLWLYF